MNEHHARVCGSPEWAEFLQTVVLPAVTAGVALGDSMLEIGPGPGAATDWLRHRVKHLTAVEVDAAAAELLATRYAGTNVEIVAGTATELSYEAGTFDSVGSFTMLHHVPTLTQQNKILFEAFRVLRPGGVLICSDSLASSELHHFHVDDTYNPIEPASVIGRLQTIGFDKITVTVDEGLRFVAAKPLSQPANDAEPGNDEGAGA